MTDKEKIRLEILRRRDSLSPFDYENDSIEWSVLNKLLEFIDSLPERIKAEDVIGVSGLTELEKKAKRYAVEQVLCTTDTRMSEQAYLSLRIFNGYDVACAYKDGAEEYKEQMMKDAVNAEILEVSDNYSSICDYTHLELNIEDDVLEKNGYKNGDKVKLIILKED